MKGYVCFPRGWLDNPIFGSVGREPYSRHAAWAWLVEAAAYRPTEVRVGVKTVPLEPGQILVSIRHLVGQWGWTPTKVVRFIKAVQRAQMVVTATDTGLSLITICNFKEIYQSSIASGTPTDAQPVQPGERTGTGTNKEEGINKIQTPPLPLLGDQSAKPKKPRAKPADYGLDFAAFYAAYPRRTALGAAERAYRKARQLATAEQILRGAESFAKTSYGRDERYLAYPATWLNDKRWLDEAPPPNDAPKPRPFQIGIG